MAGLVRVQPVAAVVDGRQVVGVHRVAEDGVGVDVHAVDAVGAEAQALVPQPPTDASPSWPPTNDLWKDELRYYGTAPRR